MPEGKMTLDEWETFLGTPDAVSALGASEVARRRKDVAKKRDLWEGKPDAGGTRTGGLCCSSNWADGLRSGAESAYVPSTPCDSVACRKRGTRYPAYYVKLRTWGRANGGGPRPVRFLCEDCWHAWLAENVDGEVLQATAGKSGSFLVFRAGQFDKLESSPVATKSALRAA